MDSREEMCMEFMALGNLLRRFPACSRNLNESDECSGKNGWILMYIKSHPDEDIFQKDIEEAFSFSRSGVSKTITSLEKSGFICRETADHDARLKKLSLTEKAHELYEKTRAEMMDSWRKVTADLTDDEIEGFVRIVKKIEKNIQKQEGKD